MNMWTQTSEVQVPFTWDKLRFGYEAVELMGLLIWLFVVRETRLTPVM